MNDFILRNVVIMIDRNHMTKVTWPWKNLDIIFEQNVEIAAKKANVGLFADLMFDYLDNDGSGVIDFVEFYQVIIVTELCLSDKVSVPWS